MYVVTNIATSSVKTPGLRVLAKGYSTKWVLVHNYNTLLAHATGAQDANDRAAYLQDLGVEAWVTHLADIA